MTDDVLTLADRLWAGDEHLEIRHVFVRNVWRQYGGWYDGNPAHLKPAREAVLAGELAALAGGARRLADRASALAGSAADGDLRLAGHLVELAALAEPDDMAIHAARADVFRARVAAATSTMAKGIFAWAQAESERKATPPPG
jgi:alkyl sulfatase BDS1-like metallo-beta-lactamase superfamily hydrolase